MHRKVKEFKANVSKDGIAIVKLTPGYEGSPVRVFLDAGHVRITYLFPPNVIPNDKTRLKFMPANAYAWSHYEVGRVHRMI